MTDERAVAIVGIGCRYPGGADDAASFWRLLSEGVDAIREVPPNRIDLQRYYDARPATPGRMMSRWGGFLDDIESFDPYFFGISPREAERLDPQQRLLLETAWEALEDAGQDVRRLEGSDTGVYVGQWVSDFESRLFADPQNVDFPMTTGSGRYAASGRISYAFGLRGPSLTLDTACSSSLVAVHLAVQALRSGECTLALAGGVNVILQPHISVAYSQMRMMAPDGHCKFGDASGDGYVRSEGAGLVALKRLDRALADGDRILAVIRGSAINNDGRSSGVLGRPSRVGHEEMLRAAYADAGVAPGRVGYVEAHGTGTRAGDPVEIAALGAVLGEDRASGAACLIGSVKTNIGHTEAAAGIAGLLKTVLALGAGVVPPSLHFVEPNPNVPWSELPFRVPTRPSDWPVVDGPRMAGVNSFGIAGTNAHVVLEQAPDEREPAPAAQTQGPALLVLSARSADAVRELALRHAELLERDDAPAVHDVCWSAATRRTPLERRACVVADDNAQMAASLRALAADADSAQQVVPDAEDAPRIVFVFPGQGGQWAGMARELMAREPAFREALQRCDEAARPWLDVSIVDQLADDAPSERIDVVQPVLFAVEIAYAALWRSIGIEPDAVVGHSMGEVAAACVAGALDVNAAMRIVCSRSALMKRVSGRGAMALVELSMADAQSRIEGRPGQLAVAVSNSPRSCVVSGDPEAVQALMDQLERDGVFCRLVKVDVASHGPQMDPLAAELEAGLAGLAPGDAKIALYSTVLGRRAEGRELGAGYWARNLRHPVLFTDAVSRLVSDGIRVIIEMGPHPVLLASVEQTTRSLGVSATLLASARRDEPQQHVLRAALGGLWACGVDVDWRRAMPRGRTVTLPRYPWQRERHWLAIADVPTGEPGMRPIAAGIDDESQAWLHELQWRASEPNAARGGGRWLVAADDVDAAQALASAMQAAGAHATAVHVDQVGTEIQARSHCNLLVLAQDDADTPWLPVRVLQAVLPCAAACRLWFVTCGSQSIGPAPVAVQAAALWGAARVIAQEHPQHWGGLVDLDPGVPLSMQVPSLVRHLEAGDGEDQVALRAGSRYVLRVAPAGRVAAQGVRWRADAAYLITGGLGGVGLHIARAMAARGARRLVLVGRTPLPPREQWSVTPVDTPAGRRIAAVRELESQGVAVHLAALDVSDEAQLRAFLARYAAEAWPPIRGVIHAAGALDNHLAASMDRRAFDAVMRPKLVGARLLDRLLPDLDLFILFSSIGAFLAQPGQANYAAANAGLDALARDRRARGLPALSVAWGVWNGIGLVEGDAGERMVAEMAREGVRGFEPARGVALFDHLCGRGDPHVAVVPLDMPAFARTRRARTETLWREVCSTGGVDTDGVALADTDPQARRRMLDAVVRDALSRVLKMPVSRIQSNKTFGSMGLTSLMAMELRNRLEASLGCALSATLAWNHPTVEALVRHLAGPDAEPAQPTAEEPAIDPLLAVDGIAELSDEEAALALRAPSRGRVLG